MEPNELESLANLADRLAIIEVLHRYAFAIDTRDWIAFRQLFTDDVDADLIGFKHWTNLDAWVTDFEAGHAAMVSTQHVITNEVVEIDGDRARANSYGTNRINQPDSAQSITTGCSYHDDLVRTADGWRITRRICRILWRSGQNVTSAATGPDSLWGAAADGEIAYFARKGG
jgi:3-phenylpropionate/cinnamic acid dioxygenase small subunit